MAIVPPPRPASLTDHDPVHQESRSMITLTRSQVRRLRAAFRRSALGIAHRGIIPPLVLRADGAQLRAHYRYRDLAVEHVGPGNYRPAETVAIPLDALADFEGPADTPVVLEAVAPDRIAVRWQDRGIPQSREYDVIPADSAGEMPELPTSWASNPAELLAALAEATETGTPDSNRYALECLQLQGSRNRIIATDGRQLLARTGFSLPWTEDVLIKGSPIFACRALPRDQPVDVGRTDTHVVFRVGPWIIACEVPKDVRFPEVERVIPQPAEVVTRLRLDPEDARFLASALERLPGADDLHAPVTIDVNGKVAVRAQAPDRPQQVTELVLGRSSSTGSPICLCTDRVLLERALRLGFRELGFTAVDSPFVCRDAGRIYAVQPLSGGSAPGADVEVIRIESGAASGGESRGVTHTETTRSPISEREPRNGHGPMTAAEVSSRSAARPAGPVSTGGSEQPGMSLAALMQEAESLHAALADARSRTARLIAGLRRQRKQSRLVNETLKSLRQLRLVETGG
jgi:hypothetical protein